MIKDSRGVSAWCINHPVATILLTFALVLLGLIAFPRLPLAPLPEAEFPTIQVSAQLPGASPQTMASSVATPLEVQFSAIPGVTQMTSSSALGTTTLTLQFTLSKSIDTAAQEVQAAINTASGKLPKDMPTLPTWRKVNPADSPVLILSVSSAQMPGTELSDYPGQGRAVRQIEYLDAVDQRPVVPAGGIRRTDRLLQKRCAGAAQGRRPGDPRFRRRLCASLVRRCAGSEPGDFPTAERQHRRDRGPNQGRPARPGSHAASLGGGQGTGRPDPDHSRLAA